MKARLFKRKIKFIFQRVFRGFSDDELWCLGYTFAKYALPRLRAFRKRLCGYPSQLTKDEWKLILDKMIFAMHQIKENKGFPWAKDEIDKTNEGCKLFGEYFGDLWD